MDEGTVMERGRVTELHYIAPVSNIASIAELGLLCHDRAARIPHLSIASEDVQDIRAQKRLPNGVRLHSYVNLYFDARNAMMYVLRMGSCPPLVVLQVTPSVLDIPGAVITDGNAASSTTRFYPSPGGLAALDEQLVFARSWNHEDPWKKAELKRIRCAEVLIPERIPVEYILGLTVETASTAKVATQFGWHGKVNTDVFFR